MISDTRKEAEEKQFDLYRKTSLAERFSMVISLSCNIMRLSKRAIKRANPDKTKKEQDLLYIEINYGEKLADQLRKYLEKNEK